LKNSREWIRNRILLILDTGPVHGYDILRSLNEHVSDLRLTTLYRWLHTMESEGLVNSEIQPGPHGPDRRVYQLGVRGELRLRDILRDSIEVLMHFYDAYRHSITGNLYEIMQPDLKSPEGCILFASNPRIRMNDIATIQHLSESSNGPIEILGDSTIVTSLEIKHRVLKGSLGNIPSPNDRFSQLWISGVPDREELHKAIIEFKRVLVKGGVLRILAPFVYFNKPRQPDLGEFVRITAIQLFPELGMADGNDVANILESVFPDCGVLDIFPGLVVFWARNDNC